MNAHQRAVFAGIGVVLLAIAPHEGFGASRALLVGIDRYNEPGPRVSTNATRAMWTDLDGAVNDVVAIRELLVTRLGFRPEAVVTLTNAAATRAAILAAYESHLRDASAAGDDVLFYYSGHGSQIVNSLSSEPDRKDETIVPADSNRGADDIRDKELRRLHNEVLARGARLTVVMDSCHSGSAARGLPREGKSRFLAPDPRDVADAAPAGPAPEERGALILSAAQDFQLAREDVEEANGIEVKHGAFSLALIRALRSAAPGTPAEELFLRARAQIKGRGWAQEPVLAGPEERRRTPMFGGAAAAAASELRVPVLRVEPDQSVVLQAGLASGLGPGCELASDSASGRVEVVIERLDGADKSIARAQKGSVSALQPGDVLTLTRWAPRDEALLRVWLPGDGPSAEALSAQVAEARLLKGRDGVVWLEDPTGETPSVLVFWDAGQWWIQRDDQPPSPMGAAWSADALASRVGAKPLFVAWPLPAEAARELAGLLARRGVKPGPRASAAYGLVGRWKDGRLAYAWVRPETAGGAAPDTALPARTDWTDAGEARELAQALGASAGKLARVCGWLLMSTPPDSGAFPYRLGIRRVGDTAVLRTGALRENELYELVLTTDRQPGQGPIEPRYVYVFYIDSTGASTLMYPPPAAGSVENRVPMDKKDVPPVLELGKGVINGFEIAPPFGMDTCLLLTSAEPLPDPSVLEFDGVLTRGEGGSPLDLLCGQLAGATRGPRLRVSTPVSWGLDRLTFRTVPAAAGP